MNAPINTTGATISDIIPNAALEARSKLESIVAKGVANTGPLVERILSECPEDRIVNGRALRFECDHQANLILTAKDEHFSVHKNAFSQLVERAGVPFSYADKLRDTENPWKRTLLEHTLHQHYMHKGGRFLLRSVAGQARGFLSDHYRRLDSRPLLEAFVTACQSVNAVPFEGVANEIRTSVRAIVPQVFEPVPGEAMVFGLSWNNSDYGAGTYGISAFVLRLVCLNGMMGESAMKQVHLGGKLPEDFAFSQRTYAADTKTMSLATGDVVRAALAPAATERRINAIKAAHSVETDWRRAFGKVGSMLTKLEEKAARDAFESEDTVFLPPGKTMWRASNALSWVANTAKDPERKLELQQAAGKVIAA
jgi:hypothetical protein